MIFIARISKYEEWKNDNELENKLILVEGWARDGLTQQQIADNLGINIDTLIEYKKKYIEFSEALKRGKEIADYQVENALFKKAIGYTIQVNEQKIDKDGCVHDLVKDVHIPPDTTAQIYWLKNRKPKEWRDRVEVFTNEKELNKVEELLNKLTDEANK